MLPSFKKFKGALSETGESTNFIKANLILEGSPDDIKKSIVQQVEVPDLIHKQVSNSIFAQMFDSVKLINSIVNKSAERSIWIDARTAKITTKQEGVTLALFIAYYGRGEGAEIARAF